MESEQDVLRLRPGQSGWPQELDLIDAPPAGLWARGRVDLLGQQPRIAIVGTRAPTPYGLGQAQRFAARLAQAGVCIVSGMARGIDQAAHEAALEVRGATVAVLGSAVDRPWPTVPLTDELVRHGLLLSEFPPGTGPRKHHFPQRNRLIAGLAQAVVVIEAAHISGSLITARFAADMGRAVYALPGRVDHPMARGCHRLLRDGASLLEEPEELLRELGAAPGKSAPAPAGSPLLAALEGETLSADELAERSGSELPQVLVELVQLELRGEVTRGPGGLWRRTH